MSAEKKNWEYKLKSSFLRKGMNKDWQKCTAEEMARLKKMRPLKFDYREIKPPSPTPSMTQDQTSGNTEEKGANKVEKDQVATKKKVKKVKK